MKEKKKKYNERGHLRENEEKKKKNIYIYIYIYIETMKRINTTIEHQDFPPSQYL